MGRLVCGIVFNINILKACLEERACSSTKVKLNGIEVHFREVFHSVHAKVFEAHCVVGVQQISMLFRGFELHHCVLFCLVKKDTQLVIPLLKVVKTSILLYNISFKLLNQVLQLLGLVFSLGATSAHLLQSFLTFWILVSSKILILSIYVACLDATMNFDMTTQVIKNFVKYMYIYTYYYYKTR